MISTPATGCCCSNFCSKASAGGHEEQPSEVNSSTSTGVRGASVAGDCAYNSEPEIAQKRASAEAICNININAARFFILVISLALMVEAVLLMFALGGSFGRRA